MKRLKRMLAMLGFKLIAVILKLIQQHRHKIKGNARLGISLQMVSHVRVIFHGM